jgi:hypothetical protein
VTFDDEGYEWCETTNFEQKASGQRMFIKGRPLDRTVELTNGIRQLADRLESSDSMPNTGALLAHELRALL